MKKGTPLATLGLHANTTNRLQRAGIRTIEQMSRMPIEKLKAVHSLSKAQFLEIQLFYSLWHEQNICPTPPPLPPNWKPITQRGENRP